MIKRIFIGGTITGAIMGILSYIFGEALFIYVLDKLHPILTFILFYLFTFPISLLVYYKCKNIVLKNNISKYLSRIRTEGIKNSIKWKKYFPNNNLLTLFLTSIFAGVFVFSAIIASSEIPNKKAIYYLLADHLIFYLFWVLFYSGVLAFWFKVVIKAFNQI